MKRFTYIDGQGNLIGPATMRALEVLHKARVIGDSAQVMDEQSNRMTMGQLIKPPDI